MLGWSYAEENVLKLLQITQIQLSIQIKKIAEKIKKTVHFSPTLLRGVPS